MFRECTAKSQLSYMIGSMPCEQNFTQYMKSKRYHGEKFIITYAKGNGSVEPAHPLNQLNLRCLLP